MNGGRVVRARDFPKSHYVKSDLIRLKQKLESQSHDYCQFFVPHLNATLLCFPVNLKMLRKIVTGTSVIRTLSWLPLRGFTTEGATT